MTQMKKDGKSHVLKIPTADNRQIEILNKVRCNLLPKSQITTPLPLIHNDDVKSSHRN